VNLTGTACETLRACTGGVRVCSGRLASKQRRTDEDDDRMRRFLLIVFSLSSGCFPPVDCAVDSRDTQRLTTDSRNNELLARVVLRRSVRPPALPPLHLSSILLPYATTTGHPDEKSSLLTPSCGSVSASSTLEEDQFRGEKGRTREGRTGLVVVEQRHPIRVD
jgi:hypothetical protein